MAVPKNISGSDQALYTGSARLYGWTLRETGAAAAATAVIYDGASATGNILGEVSLAASGEKTVWFGPQGLTFVTGIYIDVSGTGVIAGSLFIG